MEGAMTTRSKHRRHEEDQEMTMVELRRGPWTLEEDNLLMNYIACHGEGRWNLLARCSGTCVYIYMFHFYVNYLSYISTGIMHVLLGSID
jgi:hypothetical protein